MSIKVVDFYKKGAVVVAEGAGFSNSSFSYEAAESHIGIKPHPAAKPISDPAYEVLNHQGKNYLLLNKGHVYDVKFDSKHQDQTIDATSEHTVWKLPRGAKLSHAVVAE